jgi:hypothetical protein
MNDIVRSELIVFVRCEVAVKNSASGFYKRFRIKLQYYLKKKYLTINICFRGTKSENNDELMLSCGNEYSEPINAYVLPDSRITKLCSAR